MTHTGPLPPWDQLTDDQRFWFSLGWNASSEGTNSEYVAEGDLSAQAAYNRERAGRAVGDIAAGLERARTAARAVSSSFSPLSAETRPNPDAEDVTSDRENGPGAA